MLKMQSLQNPIPSEPSLPVRRSGSKAGNLEIPTEQHIKLLSDRFKLCMIKAFLSKGNYTYVYFSTLEYY